MIPVVTRLSIALAIIFLCLFFCACSGDSWEPIRAQQQAMLDKRQKDQEALRQQHISIGVVTGPDFRMCPSPCCGGWNIKIDSSYYTFSDFPENSGIDPSQEKFPLNVHVVWSRDTLLQCNHIDVHWMNIETSPFPVSATFSSTQH